MFSRSWRLYQLLFPGTGSEFGRPNNVSQVVSPIWDVFANRPGEFFFRQSQTSRVGAGTVSLEEPGAGRIQIPVLLAFGTDTGVAGSVEVSVQNTANPVDTWGRWGAFGAPINGYDAVAYAAATFGRLAVPPYVMRGSNLTVNFVAGGAGANNSAALYWVDAPGELVNLVSLAVTFGVR